MSDDVRPPAQKGRWAFVTTDLRVLLTCGKCGNVVQGSYRTQHNKFHEWLEELARQVRQPDLFAGAEEPPPF